MEAVDHGRDERAVVLDHLVFEGHADEVALGERSGLRGLEERPHVVLRIEVGASAGCQQDRCGDPHRQAGRHAGEAKLHGLLCVLTMSQTEGAVNSYS